MDGNLAMANPIVFQTETENNAIYDKYNSYNELKDRYCGISASSLNWFDISAKYFKCRVDGTIKDRPSPETELGSQVHMYLLEPNKFSKYYKVLTFDKPKVEKQKDFCTSFVELKKAFPELTDEDIAVRSYSKVYITDKKSNEKVIKEATTLLDTYKDYINFIANKNDREKIINDSTMRYLKEVKYLAESHTKAKELLFNIENDIIYDPNLITFNEKRIYWEHPVVKLYGKPLVLKSIIDRLIIDKTNKKIILIDLKTTNKLHKLDNKLSNNTEDNDSRYDRQLVFYWMAIEYLLKTEYTDVDIDKYTCETYVVGIQTPNVHVEYPVDCQVFNVKYSAVQFNTVLEIEELLKKIVWHIENDKWEHSKVYYDKGIDCEII